MQKQQQKPAEKSGSRFARFWGKNRHEQIRIGFLSLPLSLDSYDSLWIFLEEKSIISNVFMWKCVFVGWLLRRIVLNFCLLCWGLLILFGWFYLWCFHLRRTGSHRLCSNSLKTILSLNFDHFSLSLFHAHTHGAFRCWRSLLIEFTEFFQRELLRR